DAGAALARDLVAAGDVDDVDRGIDELGAEARREVVAAALEKNDVEAGMPRGDLLERVEVHRRVLADGGVRAAAGLHADDAVGGQRLAADEKLHVLAREDVVGEDPEAIAVAHRLAQGIDERRLAGSNRPADPDSEGCLCHGRPIHHGGHEGHGGTILTRPVFPSLSTVSSVVERRQDLNNLECTYCCVIAAMSTAGANDSRLASRLATRSTTAGTRSSVRASSACAPVWPIGISRMAAEMVAASRVY